MDEQGGSRAGNQVFALRQVAKDNGEGKCYLHTFLYVFYKAVRAVTSRSHSHSGKSGICHIGNWVSYLLLSLSPIL